MYKIMYIMKCFNSNQKLRMELKTVQSKFL